VTIRPTLSAFDEALAILTSHISQEEHGMPVLVRIPTPLRTLTKGSAEVQVTGETVGALVESLEGQFPGMRDRLVDETGELRRFINVYVNEEDVRFLDGKETALKEGDQVSIVPAIAGGR
jgi:molybdopterin synthase sulfur carrier subunit